MRKEGGGWLLTQIFFFSSGRDSPETQVRNLGFGGGGGPERDQKKEFLLKGSNRQLEPNGQMAKCRGYVGPKEEECLQTSGLHTLASLGNVYNTVGGGGRATV